MSRIGTTVRSLFLCAALAVAFALPDSVLITPTGARYHVSACPSIRGASALVFRASADSAGYTACRRCLSPHSGALSKFSKCARRMSRRSPRARPA